MNQKYNELFSHAFYAGGGGVLDNIQILDYQV